MDFYNLLTKQAQKYANKTAVNFRDSEITFEQLRDLSLKAAAGLSNLGIGKSDKTAFYLPNIPEYMFSFLGAFLLRAVAVPLDFMLTQEELINFIVHSESKVLVTLEKKGVDLPAIKAACPSLKKIVLLSEEGVMPGSKNLISWKEFLNSAPASSLPQPDPADASSIFYTSGSTGHPKGVLLTYAHFENPVQAFEYFLHPSDKDSLICPGIPFSHLGGLDYMLLMLNFGATLTLQDRFHPLEFLKGIQQYRPTIFCIVPAMYVAILSLKDHDKFDLSSLRYAVVFGAPSSPVLLERFLKACPNAMLLNGWGLTETAAPNSFLPTGTNAREIPNTGKFMPGTEAQLVDDEGNVLSGPAEGELWLKGKAIMTEYFKEPELTREVKTTEGWFKTGDISCRDEQGRYSIVGRIKEMIKVGGEIVFEPEVEAVLQRHPAIKEAAVIGVRDELRGEVPKAFVVLNDGLNLSDNDLRVFLRQHIAHFKIPHHFEFVPALAKNRVGKIDKESLRKK